jgi:hypothetical protein
MPPSGMLRRVALLRTEVSEKRSASIIKLKRISELTTKGAGFESLQPSEIVSILPQA